MVLERLHEQPGGEELTKLAERHRGRGPRRRRRPRPAAGANAQGARRGRLRRGRALRRRAAGDARAASVRAPRCSPSTTASEPRPSCGRRAGSTSPTGARRAIPSPAPCPRCDPGARRRTSPAGTSPSTPSPSRCPASGPGELVAVEHGLADLERGLLRVLHDAQLHRRPHPPAAARPLPGPAGVRGRAPHRRARRPGARATAPWTPSRGDGSAPSCGSRWRSPTGCAALQSLGRLGVLGALGLAGALDEAARRTRHRAAPGRRHAAGAAAGAAAVRKPPRRARERRR